MDYSKIIPCSTMYSLHVSSYSSSPFSRWWRSQSMHSQLLSLYNAVVQRIMHNTAHLRYPPLRNDLPLPDDRGCCPDHTRQLLACCKEHGDSPKLLQFRVVGSHIRHSEI